MTHAPQSAAAFSELVDALAEARDRYVLDPSRAPDELDALDGFRYLLHLVSEASELFVEGDPERPRFTSIVSPSRKFLGDNPDAIYHQALIRGDRAYRVTGRRAHEAYISFTIHAPDPAGGINGPILADLNDRSFTVAPDGRFELVLGGPEREGNWVPLDPSARIVLVRSYFLQDPSIRNDPSAHVELAIEALDAPGPAPVMDDATLAQRLRDATAFLRATTTGMRVFGEPSAVPFVANEPNDVGTPWSFRNADVDAAGAVDIFYSSGNWDLGPDQAMLMEGTLPKCDFVNVMLWNVHMQTLEYCTRTSSVNGEQIVLRDDGTYRVVVAGRDPGVPNWLDTGGHRHGTIFWRFLLPAEDPERPRCRVVDVDEVASLD
jgi:hypothetical protein